MLTRLASLLAVALLLLLSACAPTAAPTPTPAPATQATAKPAASTPAPAATPASQATAKPAAAATTPASGAASKPLEKIKIMTPSNALSFLPAYFGKDKGIFAAEGVDLQIINLQSTLGVAALLNGEVDFTDLLAPTLQAYLMGEPVRLLNVQKARTSWRFIFGKGVTSIQQVKGKAVGLNSLGSFNQYAAEQAIKHLGLNPKTDVTFVAIRDYKEVTAGLESGAIAAASMSSPTADQAVAAGFKQAVDTSDIIDIATGALGTTLKRIQQNPDQVKRVLKSYIKSAMYIRDNQSEIVPYVMKQWSLDKDIAEAVVARTVTELSYDGSISDKGLQITLDVIHQDGGPTKDATLDQLRGGFDLTTLRLAQQELGIAR